MSRGSVTRYEGRNGSSYHIRVGIGYNDKNNPIHKRYTVHGTKRDAQVKLREILAQLDKGTTIKPNKMCLDEFITKWYETHRRCLSPTTDRRYKDYINTHIIPVLGNIELQKFTTLNIQEFINYMLEVL